MNAERVEGVSIGPCPSGCGCYGQLVWNEEKVGNIEFRPLPAREYDMLEALKEAMAKPRASVPAAATGDVTPKNDAGARQAGTSPEVPDARAVTDPMDERCHRLLKWDVIHSIKYGAPIDAVLLHCLCNMAQDRACQIEGSNPNHRPAARRATESREAETRVVLTDEQIDNWPDGPQRRIMQAVRRTPESGLPPAPARSPAEAPSDETPEARKVIDAMIERLRYLEVTEAPFGHETRALLWQVYCAARAAALQRSGSPAEAPSDEDMGDADHTALEVLCRVFEDGADVAMQEWQTWYKPEQWLGYPRALGAFIAGRLLEKRDFTPDEREAIEAFQAAMHAVSGKGNPPMVSVPMRVANCIIAALRTPPAAAAHRSGDDIGEWLLGNFADLYDVLTNVHSLLQGWSQDGSPWSEWDESVRLSVVDAQKKLDKWRFAASAAAARPEQEEARDA